MRWTPGARSLRTWPGRPEAATRAIETSYSAGAGAAEDLRRACERLLPAERRRGHSLAGPHRDDLVWTRSGKPLTATVSSGEVHRVAALAKLAEWRAVAAAVGEPPLLCVDDFDMGLSPSAAEAFWDALPPGATVVLTTASDPGRWTRRAAAVYEMRQGSAFPYGARRAVND